MKFLFNIVHPAKVQLFRHAINELKRKGHFVDIVIISKDILEDLVVAEGWPYTNIFPKGRRIKYIHIYFSAAINLVRTIFRLLKFTKGKNYDLIITDDLSTFIGRIRGIPSILFTDDDLKSVPESIILLATANYVLSPAVTNIGFFSYKKIAFQGIKALAHLHPNIYSPSEQNLNSIIDTRNGRYFLIRCVSVTSTHDVGNKGIPDELLLKIVKKLSLHGKVIINSQRELPGELMHYAFSFDKTKINDLLFYASIFISDSSTMCSEACILGTPTIEINDWFYKTEQYKILNQKYKLLNGYTPRDEKGILLKIDEYLSQKNTFELHKERSNIYVKDQINVSEFMVWLFEEYPLSVQLFYQDPTCQTRFTK